MTDTTQRLALPLLAAGQAQKHVTHNEALVALDAVVHLAVIDNGRSAPPAGAQDGDRHIVGTAPTAEWAGQAGRIAALDGAAWMFLTPRAGWLAYVESERRLLMHDGGGWGDVEVRSARQFGINATADSYNRLSINAPASLFNNEGAGHRLTINRNAANDTASQIFSTNFSARAEIGLMGSDIFQLKVSPDGASFLTALSADGSGLVRMPAQPLNSFAMTGAPSAALPANSWTTVSGSLTSWSPIVARPASSFNTATGQFQPSAAGLHHVSAALTLVSTGSAGQVQAALWRNGAMLAGSAQIASIQGANAPVSLRTDIAADLAAGDGLELRVMASEAGVKLMNGGCGRFTAAFAG